MNLIPPSYTFSGDRNKSIGLKSQALQFYNFHTTNAIREGLTFINRREILPDSSEISITSYRLSGYDNWSGNIKIHSTSNPFTPLIGKEVKLYFAPPVFQIPEGHVGTTVYLTGPYAIWQSLTNITSVTFSGCHFPDILSSTNPIVDASTTITFTKNDVFTRSSYEKPVQLSSIKEGKNLISSFQIKKATKYGSRGFGDAPFNAIWKSTDKTLIANASLRTFRNISDYQSVLPIGDTRSKNFIRWESMAFSGTLPSSVTLTEPPVAKGVYISNNFYCFPSTLTSNVVTINDQGYLAAYHVAARPTLTEVLTACTIGGTFVGHTAPNPLTQGNLRREGTSIIRLGYSSLVAPTIVENIIMADGTTLPHKLSGTLSPISTPITIDQNGTEPGKSVIAWMDISPDCKFLYAAVFHTLTTGASITEVTNVDFRIKRWAIFDPSSSFFGISAPYVLYSSSVATNLSFGTEDWDRIAGGFRCQVNSDGSHLIGFLRNRITRIPSAHTGNYDLRSIKINLSADAFSPTPTTITTTDTVIFSNIGRFENDVADHTTPIKGLEIHRISYADYQADRYIFQDTGTFFPATNTSTFGDIKYYLSGVLETIPNYLITVSEAAVEGGLGDGRDYYGLGAFKSNLQFSSPMMDVMFGNTCEEIDGVVYIQTSNKTTGAPAILAIATDTGSFKITSYPSKITSRYIVTSNE